MKAKAAGMLSKQNIHKKGHPILIFWKQTQEKTRENVQEQLDESVRAQRVNSHR